MTKSKFIKFVSSMKVKVKARTRMIMILPFEDSDIDNYTTEDNIYTDGSISTLYTDDDSTLGDI